MTSEATNDAINKDLVGAVATWKKSVDQIETLIDRAAQQDQSPLSPSDHDDFSAALLALYALEAAIFPVEPMDLPQPANASWSSDG